MTAADADPKAWLMDAVPAYVPPRGRTLVFAIEFMCQMGDEPTVTSVAEILGMNERIGEQIRNQLLGIQEGDEQEGDEQ